MKFIPGTSAWAQALLSSPQDAMLWEASGHPFWKQWRSPTAGVSVLHVAPAWRCPPARTVDFLVAQGLDMNTVDDRGRSALFFVLNSPRDTRLAWLEALAEVGPSLDLADKEGCTVLSEAVLHQDEGSTAWLIAAGSQPTETDRQAVLRSNSKACLSLFWNAFGQAPEGKALDTLLL